MDSGTQYCEIALVVPPDALEAVTHLLHDSGTGGVIIDDDARAELRAYLPRDEHLATRLLALRRSLTDLVAFFPGMSEWRQQERFVQEEDWANAWRDHFHAVRVGRRLVVAPTWEPRAAQADEVVVRLDPGMAFGTGTHASTVLCLRALEELVAGPAHVLDVGTGSGILAIAAALLGAGEVTALDIDPLAVRVARQNAQVNKVSDRVHVHYAELRDRLRDSLPRVDLAVANLTADLLVGILPDLAQALAPGARAVLSGIIGPGAADLEAALAAGGWRVLQESRLEDWLALWVSRG